MRRTIAIHRDLMTRVILACFLSLLVTAASAQAPSPPSPPAPAKAVAKKKPAAKPKPAGTPSVAAESGPCSIGVISAIGDRFSVQKFGVTVFANDKTFVPIDWGLDDLVMARVRAEERGQEAERQESDQQEDGEHGLSIDLRYH